MSYVYLKKKLPSGRETTKRIHLAPKTKNGLAAVLVTLGLGLFISAVGPLVSFQLEYSSKFGQLISPLSNRFYAQNGNVLGQVTTDYTRLNNWFGSDSAKTNSLLSSVTPMSYHLSIPSLKIDNALVEAGSMDLKKSLVQYPQTAMPGNLGNTVIFGHSVLPQFFNPKSYLTIFATLYKLKQGDDIIITYDNVTYKYKVDELYEVPATDLSVLEQRFDDRYLTLITCSPPGTYLRRLIISAKISS